MELAYNQLEKNIIIPKKNNLKISYKVLEITNT